MKGLLVKDWKLMKAQKNFVLAVVIMCVVFLSRGQEISYVFAYLSAMFAILIASTISYDQADNGLNFIFTFPVSREKYVLAKYVFGVLAAVCMAVIFSASVLAAKAANMFSYSLQGYFTGLFGVLLTAAGIMSVMIPLLLKFGSEKSRIVMLIFLGFGMFVVYVAQQAAETLHVDLTPLTERIRQMGPVETAVCLGVLAAGMLVISYMVSVAVMRRKQF